MGCAVVSGHIHACYLVNFVHGLKSSILGSVQIFYNCVDLKVHTIVSPNKLNLRCE